jgi:hypothetical protein
VEAEVAALADPMTAAMSLGECRRPSPEEKQRGEGREEVEDSSRAEAAIG